MIGLLFFFPQELKKITIFENNYTTSLLYYMIKRTIIFGICICFSIASTSIFGQKKKDTLIAFQYYQKADSLLKHKNYSQSIDLFTKAIPIYEKINAWNRVARCYNKISENQWRDRKIEKSLQNAKKALKISDKEFIENNNEKAISYYNIGNSYSKLLDYKNALLYFQKVIDIEQNTQFANDLNLVVDAYKNMGIVYFHLGDYQKAIHSFRKTLDINIKIYGLNHDKVGKSYHNIGNIYLTMDKYSTAIEYYKKSLDIEINTLGKEHLDVGITYFNMATIYTNIIDSDQALNYLEKAHKIFKKNKNSPYLSYFYLNKGTILKNKGELDKALSYFYNAIETGKKHFGEQHRVITTSYHHIGNILTRKEKYDEALKYYSKSMTISKKIYGENHNRISDLYNAIGKLHGQKKDYDLALDYMNKGIAIQQESVTLNYINKLLNLGGIYFLKKNYKGALNQYRKGLKVLQDFNLPNHILSIEIYNRIAFTYHQQKQYKKSLDYFNKAIQINSKNNSDINQTIFIPDSHYKPKILLETLKGKSMVFQSLYEKHKNLDYLNKSINLNKNADVLINYIRKSFQNYQDKVTLAKQAKEVYTNAITANLLLYKETNNLKTLKQALYYAEKSKANVLKELLADSNAKGFSGLPKELLTLERTLKSNRAFYQSQITKERSKDSIDLKKEKKFQSSLFAIKRREDSLTKIFEKDYPKYYQLKHKNEVVSVSEIQQQLNNKTTVLEFFTSDSITYAFTITKKDIKVKELITPKLETHIEQFSKAITSEDNTMFKEIGYTLFKELISPVKDNILGNNLIIIPDGALWHLNFDLLLTQQETEKSDRNLSYLLRNYAISYANSTNLLFKTSKYTSKPLENKNECLAFSFSDSTNPSSNTSISLASLRNTSEDLPGTRQEIKAISEIIDGQYYYGPKSIETNFKKHANTYSILHLALHGEVDHNEPLNSRLYFTKSKDTLEDNLLYSHELFALNIPAELAVLSACNTGTGKIANGEGVLSLGTAFQYAGTKSLLLSHWEVSDKSTPQLMKNFYTNLAKGMNKAEALQQAKLTFLNTTEAFYTNAFYWGSFYLLGDTKAIDISETYTTYYWISGGLLMLIILFLLYRKRKSIL